MRSVYVRLFFGGARTFRQLAFLPKHKIAPSQDKSAVRFCRKVAAWVSDMYRDFNLAKSQKIANNSASTEARVKIRTDLEP